MKIVINKCYGGFGLSEEAQCEIYRKGCEHSKLIEPREFFGENHEHEMKEVVARRRSLYQTPIVEGKILSDDHSSEAARACPVLVSVVESMGAAANGVYSKLKVVEIPDGTEFVVHEYDGHESVHEKHEAWS